MSGASARSASLATQPNSSLIVASPDGAHGRRWFPTTLGSRAGVWRGDAGRRVSRRAPPPGVAKSCRPDVTRPPHDGHDRKARMGAFGLGRSLIKTNLPQAFGSRPSRWARFRASFRARRTASSFSRALRSEGFSKWSRRLISRKRPSRCIFFLSAFNAWSTLLSRTTIRTICRSPSDSACKCKPLGQ